MLCHLLYPGLTENHWRADNFKVTSKKLKTDACILLWHCIQALLASKENTCCASGCAVAHLWFQLCSRWVRGSAAQAGGCDPAATRNLLPKQVKPLSTAQQTLSCQQRQPLLPLCSWLCTLPWAVTYSNEQSTSTTTCIWDTHQSMIIIILMYFKALRLKTSQVSHLFLPLQQQ